MTPATAPRSGPALPPAQSAFLTGTDWAAWVAQAMPGDADARRYWMLRDTSGDGMAVLMDMSMSPAAAFDAFCRIGAYLRDNGLCAPRVLHAVPGIQMLLLENLGPQTLAAAVRKDAALEPLLYSVASEAILALHAIAPPANLSVLTPQVGGEMLAPLFDFYVRRTPATAALDVAMAEALEACAGLPDKLSLRDYFSENLIWRGERCGLDRLGILDFQDAFLAPATYDLASLIHDARREVSTAAKEAALTVFAERTGTERAALEREIAVLTVQRNLRILGIFARLAKRDGKTRYLPMIPRVRAHVLRGVAHPALARLRAPVEAALNVESLL